MVNDIISQLKRDEGFRENVYTDTRGHKTIGYGRNLDVHPLTFVVPPITEDMATTWLVADVQVLSDKLASLLSFFDGLDTARAGALLNMAYNMGLEGLLSFHQTLSYVAQGQYDNAATQMVLSEWCQQVGARGARLASQMSTGQWT